MAPAYDGKERRRHYRIRYPIMRRPQVDVWGKRFEDVDVSEGGVRFNYPHPEDVELGQPVQAVILFDDKESADVEGRVVRVEPRRVALELTVGIPYSRIVQEQLRLLSRSAVRPQ